MPRPAHAGAASGRDRRASMLCLRTEADDHHPASSFGSPGRGQAGCANDYATRSWQGSTRSCRSRSKTSSNGRSDAGADRP